MYGFEMKHLNAILNLVTLIIVVWGFRTLKADSAESRSWWKIAKEWFEAGRNANQDGKRILADVRTHTTELHETAEKAKEVAKEAKAQVETIIQQAVELKQEVRDIPEKTVERLVHNQESGLLAKSDGNIKISDPK